MHTVRYFSFLTVVGIVGTCFLVAFYASQKKDRVYIPISSRTALNDRADANLAHLLGQYPNRDARGDRLDCVCDHDEPPPSKLEQVVRVRTVR